VDVHSLAVTELFKKPLPGWHYKGAWTAQGRFFIAANGEDPAPSPFWKVDYTSAATRFETEKLTWPYLQTPYQPLATPRSTGQTLWRDISEDIGNLGEWDGKTWRILSRRQHLDITGPGGLTGATSDDEPVWALGWDLRSAFIKLREKTGAWTIYRLPKSSYTADGMHGSNTEWPRICDVGDGPRLMFLHNGLYELPTGFRDGHSGGLRHIASTLVTVTDMTKWNNQLVFSQQATSVHGIPFAVPGQPHYVASKAGVAMLTKAAALELATQRIRVNAIAPGPIVTPMLAERLNEPGGREWLEEKVPMGRLGEVEDCARGIAFLLSDEASYITGVTLPIDGGWLTR
jgi:hypothetical protein